MYGILLLLLLLPIVAAWLNHDVISAILIIVWTFLVSPIAILRAIDAFQKPPATHEGSDS